MEYVIDTERMLKEIMRVLKPGGILLFSVPFLCPEHDDNDSVRYTRTGWLAILAKHFNEISIVHFGGRYCALFDFYFEKVRSVYSFYFKIALFPFLSILKIVCLALDYKEHDARFPMGYIVTCKAKMT